MTAPTPMFFYVLYATPFIVAAIVLIVSKYMEWRAARDAETIEKPIVTPEDPVIDEVRSRPLRRTYATFSRPTV